MRRSFSATSDLNLYPRSQSSPFNQHALAQLTVTPANPWLPSLNPHTRHSWRRCSAHVAIRSDRATLSMAKLCQRVYLAKMFRHKNNHFACSSGANPEEHCHVPGSFTHSHNGDCLRSCLHWGISANTQIPVNNTTGATQTNMCTGDVPLNALFSGHLSSRLIRHT
jgi:hypothetical protein